MRGVVLGPEEDLGVRVRVRVRAMVRARARARARPWARRAPGEGYW